MSGELRYRLAGHTVIEPLIDQWIAWPHNFSPLLYGLHMLNYQQAVLASYLKNPRLHVDSCRNPKLLGGPFVDIAVDRMNEVQVLLADMQHHHADLLTLAQDFTQFQNTLMQTATGQCVEGCYAELPESMRGLMELGYDYDNHPVVRCFESLIYASSYYKRDVQSFRLFALEHDDARPYYMSTPRLKNPGDVLWTVPFDDQAVDALFRLDTDPQPLKSIRQLLGLTVADDAQLLPLLSSQPADELPEWQGQGLRLRYFGHASVLLESKDVTILTDPFIAVSPRQPGIDRLTFADLPARIDYVLITHGHHDHFVLESLLRLRHRIGTLVVPRHSGIFHGDLSLKLMAQKLGFSSVVEVDTLDSVAFPGGRITATPFLGEHCDLLHAKSSYVVSYGNERILLAADSCCLDPRVYERVREILGPISTVFIGMECVGAPLSWVYAPLLPVKPAREHDQSRRSHANDAHSAWQLLRAVGARQAFVYALGREPWLKYFMALTPSEDDPYMQEINKLIETARAEGQVDVQLLFGQKELFFEAD